MRRQLILIKGGSFYQAAAPLKSRKNTGKGILALFSWMHTSGFAADAPAVCEGLFSRLSWLVPVCEAMMLPVFVYWFYLQITGKTVFPKAMAFTNVLILFGVLKCVSLLLPVSAFRLGFTNGLMSESMILWFCFLLIWEGRK